MMAVGVRRSVFGYQAVVGAAITVCSGFDGSDVFARLEWYGEVVVVQVSCRKSLLSPSRDPSGVAGVA